MLLLPVPNKVLHETLVGRILHECWIDAHIFDLIEQVEPRLVNTLRYKSLVRIVSHVSNMNK